ncbi:response regulator transcription factor [Pantoea dispersa]|uniref:response regulator transcription factor n=1 Tax=Pantoea dispersa TaxID=59814 RepID=UPI0008FF2233|nr:response regulator transcription factor [Pantoea dispersa]MDT8849032.1 response regulator transcription factor [Pantoea dispersa]
MRILIIEDDSFKLESIRDFLSKKLDRSVIEICTSLSEGIINVNNNKYDLIMVDMAIPSHPITPGGGSPLSLLTGGLDILLELNYLERSDVCIIITQYPDIEIAGKLYALQDAKKEIKIQLECDVLACIEYKEGSDEWQQELEGVLKSNEYFNP